MRDLDPHYRFRAELAEKLRRDLLGPTGGVDEILDEEPATAYITGVLFPRDRGRGVDSELRAEQDVDLTSAQMAIEEVPDTGVSMANRQMPSAMGLTFAVDTFLAATVTLIVTGATYESIDSGGNFVRPQRSERRGTDDAHAVRWRRRPLSVEPLAIRVDVARTYPSDLEGGRGLQARIRVRGSDPDGTTAVTVTLINNQVADTKDLLDQFCIFQPEMHIEVPHAVPALVERRRPLAADEDEVRLSGLLHRHAPMFATGHGCAADWNWTPPPPRGLRTSERAATMSVWTTFLPDREVLLTDSNPDIDEPGMLELAEAPTGDLFDALFALVISYERWITDRRSDAAGLMGGEFGAVAGQQLDACTEAVRRMRSGIELLGRDPDVLTAFRLAGEAMADQRARTVWARGGRVGESDRRAGRWRPFQIGFVLLCLDGVVDDRHPDRGIADLLWFPTGGGKTEAYLGLIAFTTFLRRIRRGAAGAGVTVLMRYTLRLLTLQQFERAATLICAMEVMRRRDEEKLGTEPISIGMWVGKAATPNRIEEAYQSLEDLRKGRTLRECNPVQLRSCSWCGTPIDHQDYHVDLVAGRMTIRCRNTACDFRRGLPVHVVDDDLYAVRPTLVIATADKFAQIAWRDNVARLFNREGALEGTPPPELVIQDELHLISGPLGTLAGLYETAIDFAANRPKVIASTATIRRAEEQGARLFARDVRQFPPAGLDARDSWFAVEGPRADKASRRYLGVLAPSTSQATLLIRVYSALLHHAAHIDGDDRVRDTYWTLVGYFNSLRLLSAAELQVHADVGERLKQLAVRGNAAGRSVQIMRELTSRIDSSQIPQYLKELFVAHPDPSAIDVVLASNMISVGVDVDRLGLMAVMGQPQTTAEYIQSTSRVGRRDPGLIVTMLNASRSRDRSHYEDFVSYHSALYRQVESTSVTPFAARARDRALHAVLVGLVRVLHPIARPNSAAARMGDFRDEVEQVKRVILDRVERIDDGELEGTRQELDRFVENWREMARDSALVYEAPRRKPGQLRGSATALLRTYGQDEDLEDARETMWSLRDVDVESHLYMER